MSHHPHRLGAAQRPQPSAGDPGFPFSDILAELPEFVPRYLELVAACDGAPGEPVVLTELAELVAGRIAVIRTASATVARAIHVVELLVDARQGDEAACEPVAYAFFDSFSIEDRRYLVPRLGSRSRRLLESLEVAPPGERP